MGNNAEESFFSKQGNLVRYGLGKSTEFKGLMTLHRNRPDFSILFPFLFIFSLSISFSPFSALSFFSLSLSLALFYMFSSAVTSFAPSLSIFIFFHLFPLFLYFSFSLVFTLNSSNSVASTWTGSYLNDDPSCCPPSTSESYNNQNGVRSVFHSHPNKVRSNF